MNFPTHSPEFNPQEQVWKALRQNVTHNRFEYGTDVPDWACDMRLFFCKGREALQATDRVQYRKYLEFVEQYFSDQRA